MNWELVITAAVGIISGGAIAGFYLRKQTRGEATAGVVKESMEALRSALETLFVRKGASINDKTVNHEQIHSKQIEEVMFTLFLPFFIVAWHTTFYLLIAWIFSYYIWYSAEFLINLIRFKERHLAYRRISFEREAYTFETDLTYLNRNNNFAFFKYIK